MRYCSIVYSQELKQLLLAVLKLTIKEEFWEPFEKQGNV